MASETAEKEVLSVPKKAGILAIHGYPDHKKALSRMAEEEGITVQELAMKRLQLDQIPIPGVSAE